MSLLTNLSKIPRKGRTEESYMWEILNIHLQIKDKKMSERVLRPGLTFIEKTSYMDSKHIEVYAI